MDISCPCYYQIIIFKLLLIIVIEFIIDINQLIIIKLSSFYVIINIDQVIIRLLSSCYIRVTLPLWKTRSSLKIDTRNYQVVIR